MNKRLIDRVLLAAFDEREAVFVAGCLSLNRTNLLVEAYGAEAAVKFVAIERGDAKLCSLLRSLLKTLRSAAIQELEVAVRGNIRRILCLPVDTSHTNTGREP